MPQLGPVVDEVATFVEHRERLHVVGPQSGDGAGRDGRELLVGEAGVLGVQPEHVPVLHRLGDLDGYRSEVLTDDRRAGPCRFGGDHGEQLRTRVADVHALPRLHPIGDPPQPMDTEDVVDAQQRGVLPAPLHDVAPQGEAAALGRSRELGWEPPVLPVGVHRVGRRADAHPGGEQVAMRPGLEPEWMASDRQVEGERRGAGVVQPGQGEVGEVLGQLMAGFDNITGTIGVDRIDGDLGPEPGVLGDVRGGGHPTLDVGRQLAGDLAHGVEQLRPPPPTQRPPVDQLIDVRHRCGGQGIVVEVDLVPVQPADWRVRAWIERLVEERGIERQGHQGIDPDRGERSTERR